MGKRDKLLLKAENNPQSLSFIEFESLLKLSNWVLRRQKGSHRIWYSPKGDRLPIQPNKDKAKAYQVRQFLLLEGGDKNE